MNADTTSLMSRRRKFPLLTAIFPPADPSLDVQSGQARRAAFLRILNRAWLGMGVVALLTLPFVANMRVASVAISLMALGIYALVRMLNQSGHIRLAAAIFSVMVDVTFLALFFSLADDLGAREAILRESPTLMMMDWRSCLPEH